MNDNWAKLRAIFDEGWELDQAGRQALLARHCAGDDALRAEADRMLSAHDAEQQAQAAARIRHNTQQRRFGAWETVELLGRGGMAEVWLARRADGRHEQRAALKLISPYLASPEYIERFRRETKMLARLEHPNIARLLDSGVSADGEIYLVMEYIDGRPLDRYCEENQVNVAGRVRLVQSLCSAVESAHRNLILHRDIKPSNVLVTANGMVKLVDFGTAREMAEEADATRTTAPVTPAYASPEQLRQEPATTSSDVYALGATPYRLLAGTPPFGPPASSYDTVRRMLEEEVVPPSEAPGIPSDFRREVRGGLDNIVVKALEKDPRRRYASAERMSADLERFLGKRPVEARAITWSYRAERFAARHRAGVVFAAVMAVTLMAGSVALISQARQLRNEARQNALVLDFYRRMFGLSGDRDISPIRHNPRTTPLLEAARYGASRLDTAFSGQPLVQARLASDLGIVLNETGNNKEGERVLRRGLELIDRRKNPALAAELLTNLGRSHLFQGMVQEPYAELHEALELMNRDPAGLAKDRQAILLLLAEGISRIRNAGRTPESIQILDRAVELARQFGTETAIYAAALAVKALQLADQNRFGESEQTVQQAIRIEKALPVLPVEYNITLDSLGRLRARQGRLSEAKEILGQECAWTEDTIGRSNITFQSCRMAEAGLMLQQGDAAGAAALLADVDREVVERLPQGLWLRQRAKAARAEALRTLRRPSEARLEFQAAYELVREVWGDAAAPTAQAAARLR